MKKHLSQEELNRLNELMDGSENSTPEEELLSNLESYNKIFAHELDITNKALGHVQSVYSWLADLNELSEDVIAECAAELLRVRKLLGDIAFTFEELKTYSEEDLELAKIINLGAADPGTSCNDASKNNFD